MNKSEVIRFKNQQLPRRRFTAINDQVIKPQAFDYHAEGLLVSECKVAVKVSHETCLFGAFGLAFSHPGIFIMNHPMFDIMLQAINKF